MNLWLTAGDLDSSQGCTIFVTNVRTQQTLVVMKTTNYKRHGGWESPVGKVTCLSM